MKEGIINFVAKVFGLGKLWDAIDGAKTYITGAAAIMTGLGGMLLSASAEASRFVASVHNFGDLLGFAQALSNNPDAPAKEFALAWLGVLAGCKIIAQKHSEDKKHAELLAAAAPAVVVTQTPAPDGQIPAPAQPAADGPKPN